MSNILIITYPDASIGFSLAGIEAKGIKEGDDIISILHDVIKNNRYNLIAIEERFLAGLPDELLRRIRKRGIPVIVPIDTPRSWRAEAEMESYIARLIRRAIGYQVKIKRYTK